jgi:2'-5' RNA ligase
VRLFVAVWPPESVLDQVAELSAELQDRSMDGSVRWTSRDQWHVTVRFLGEVEDPVPVVAALSDVRLTPTEARLGPRPELLGRQVVSLPVDGLDQLAAEVVRTTASVGQAPDPRPFRGHLTLARLRRGGRRVRGRDLDDAVVDARWTVNELVLVRSHLGSGGANYEILHRRHVRDGA